MLDHEHYMRRCLELAELADGRTSPNPLVGAVVVDDDGNIIAEGYHAQCGGPHAEVVALDAAGELARGKTLYVSLEPCCHFGKTPPCSDRVIASGVKRVIFGLMDPNPKVGGGGEKALQAAGIETLHGVLQPECRYINRGFFKWIEKQLPWVCLKMAATMDGRIADRLGTSRWITGATAREHVQQLRNKYDCLLIGSETALQDNPDLTVHGIANSRDPIRAVMDTRLSTSRDSKLAKNGDGKTWLFAAEANIQANGVSFRENVRLIAAPLKGKHLDLAWVLHYLGTEEVRKVLCEGGGQIGGALLQQGLVDEIEWLIAPKMLADVHATPALAGSKSMALADAFTFKSHTYKELGADMLIHGLIHEP
jgi:diaminohydroxyphosphoribosylaminopyrimidine deaminase / 5-amino-6-(5-phosphoribosylamino)uracil reductase